jgi:hypothetical protein
MALSNIDPIYKTITAYCRHCGRKLEITPFISSYGFETGKPIYNYKAKCPAKRFFLSNHTETDFNEDGKQVFYAGEY